MPQKAESAKRRHLSRGALLGLGIVVIAVAWFVYAFLGELAPPPATQRVDDLERGGRRETSWSARGQSALQPECAVKAVVRRKTKGANVALG